MTAFAELVAATNFSFLRGASHPHEMVGRRRSWGSRPSASPTAIRWPAWCARIAAAKEHQHPLPRRRAARHRRRLRGGLLSHRPRGLWPAVPPADRRQSARRSRASAISPSRRCSPRARARSSSPCRRGGSTPAFIERLRALAAAARGRVYLGAALRLRGDERRRLGELAELAAGRARRWSPPTMSLYHHPGRKPLADVLTCIREKCTIARGRLPPRGQRRAPPEDRRRDGAPVRALSAGRRAHARDRRAHPLRSGRAALRIPRRAGAAGQDPAGLPRGADLGARRRALSRRRAGQGAGAARSRSWR